MPSIVVQSPPQRYLGGILWLSFGMTFLHRKFCTVSVHNEWSEGAVLTWRRIWRGKRWFSPPCQRNCTECVPHVMGTGVAQKWTSGIHYKASTQDKFKTSLLVWRRGQGKAVVTCPIQLLLVPKGTRTIWRVWRSQVRVAAPQSCSEAKPLHSHSHTKPLCQLLTV